MYETQVTNAREKWQFAGDAHPELIFKSAHGE
jgi:hypothetical protein